MKNAIGQWFCGMARIIMHPERVIVKNPPLTPEEKKRSAERWDKFCKRFSQTYSLHPSQPGDKISSENPGSPVAIQESFPGGLK